MRKSAAALAAITLLVSCGASPLPESDGATTAVKTPAISIVSATTAVATASVAPATSTMAPTSVAPATSTTAPAPATPATPKTDWAAIFGAVIDDWQSKGVPVIPGVSVAVLLPDGTEVLVARGVADLVEKTPITTGDYFRIGSISKSITSVALLQLVAEGLVGLDEPAATYVDDLLDGYTLDNIEYGDLVTVRQLLNHTDGFAEYAFDLGFYLQTSERLDEEFEPREIIEWAISKGPQYAPGTAYEYNTVGHVVAGLVIEAVTEQPVHEVLRERIFAPLGLEAIYLPPAEDPPQPVVHGYAASALKAALDLIPATAAYPDAAVGEVYDISVIPQEAIRSSGWTGGGIEAQVSDVAHIFRAMFDGSLMDRNTVAEFLTTSEFSNYALGISVGEADVDTASSAVELSERAISYSHGGGVPGFRSHAAYYPELDVALAISTNVLPAEPDVGVLADALIAAILATTDSATGDNCQTCTGPSVAADSGVPAGLDSFLAQGPWAVGVRTLQLDDRPVEVWYPVEPTAVAGRSTEVVDSIDLISELLLPLIPGDLGGAVDTGAYRNAPAARGGGQFHVASYSHGSPGYRQAATFLTRHLASHGIVTFAVEHLGRSLTTLLTPLAGADSPTDDVSDLLNALDLVGSDGELGPVVDSSEMVVIGHSAGARTAALATSDERVAGVVLLAGVPQQPESDRPSLMVVFENDSVIDPFDNWVLHQSLDNSTFMNIAETGHAAPTDACALIQDRGGLTELREALGERLVRAGENGCLPEDADARAVQDFLQILITGFVSEVLSPQKGPLVLTADVVDLVDGVELRGFNESPSVLPQVENSD
ncbi:MAG: serine hydrolase [Acidimicrobiales bacterium]|nr:serine hydrolase [Acidimicrobiales bacterium]